MQQLNTSKMMKNREQDNKKSIQKQLISLVLDPFQMQFHPSLIENSIKNNRLSSKKKKQIYQICDHAIQGFHQNFYKQYKQNEKKQGIIQEFNFLVEMMDREKFLQNCDCQPIQEFDQEQLILKEIKRNLKKVSDLLQEQQNQNGK